MLKLEPILSIPIDEYLLTRMAFSPDGSELAVGHKQFRTYAAETGAPKAEFAYSGFVAQLRYSPDGRFVAAANVSDNHPATRGCLAVYEAGSGIERFRAEAPLPVETLTYADHGRPAVYWNHPRPQPGVGSTGEIHGAGLDPVEALPGLEAAGLQLRALAWQPDGFVCFGREAAGETQQVEKADLVFRKFHLRSLDRAGKIRHDVDLGIGAGVHALAPDGKLLAVEMVDFRNNERHVSLLDVETGVEANLLPLEANTLPVLEFGMGSEYLLCMKEDAEANFNRVRIWRTSDLKLAGEAEVALSYHSMACCLEHSLVAFLGGGKLEIFGLA